MAFAALLGSLQAVRAAGAGHPALSLPAAGGAGTEPSGHASAVTLGSEKIRRLRVHKRIPTQIRAVLYIRETFQSVLIRDVSRGGVGLTGAHGLFPGDEVEIRLVTGLYLRGVVRWWLNGHCGIAFETLLEEDAELLLIAERKNRSAAPLA
jgi:hypothetical protein